WQAGIGGAAMRGALVFGPPVGARVTFVRASDWLGKITSPPESQAQRELMRRYLGAYGPATDAEFAQWAFIEPRRAGELAKALGDAIEEVDVEGHRAWQIAGDRPGRASTSTLLLPRFDCYAVGSHPRDVVAPPDVVARAAATGLLTRGAGSGRAFLVGPMPVLLVDGTVGGIWESTRTAKHIAIRVQPLITLDAKRRRSLERAVMRIGEMVGLESSIAIGKVSTRPHL
ncbi:MAG: winged helix DNA-binding domain-containing protein, partial [Chloroflexi bacterium]